MSKNTKEKSMTWKDMKKHYDNYISSEYELERMIKKRDILYMQALWFYAITLMNEKRYFELVWIQSNLIEVLINNILHGYFFLIKHNKRDKNVKELIMNLSFF